MSGGEALIIGVVVLAMIVFLVVQNINLAKKWKEGKLDVPEYMRWYYRLTYGPQRAPAVPASQAEPAKPQSQSVGASVGGDVSGEVNVAGRDVNVIQASPGELRQCPACGGEGRFVRMEEGERIIVLCQTCNGLGQVRL